MSPLSVGLRQKGGLVDRGVKTNRRWLAWWAFAASVTLAMAQWPAPSGHSVESSPDLRQQVTVELTRYAGQQGIQADESRARVTITRHHGTWAFGTAVLVAPHQKGAYPHGWLFVARRDRDQWRIGFEGETEFASLARRAPVISAPERRVLAHAAPQAADATDRRTGMRLPYAVGQSWRFTGGPHEMSGPPRSSIDLAGGDLKVLAARAGTAYTMCKGWIRVVHDRGYATDYYHLWNAIPADGTPVAEGAFLGDAGTDVTCGGSATGRHVHFSLRRHGDYIPIAGHNLSTWVFYEGAKSYEGYALHGSTRVNVGGTLRNNGALALDQGIVDTNGPGTLRRRAGPGTNYEIIGQLPDGAVIRIACSANGTTHTGRYGASRLWHQLTDGGWVSGAYVWTGVDGPVTRWCSQG